MDKIDLSDPKYAKMNKIQLYCESVPSWHSEELHWGSVTSCLCPVHPAKCVQSKKAVIAAQYKGKVTLNHCSLAINSLDLTLSVINHI